jgi:hypothetical protein
VTVGALLNDQVVRQHALRLFGRSQWTGVVLDDFQIRVAWEHLTHPVQCSFLAQARHDLEHAAQAAMQETPT